MKQVQFSFGLVWASFSVSCTSLTEYSLLSESPSCKTINELNDLDNKAGLTWEAKQTSSQYQPGKSITGKFFCCLKCRRTAFQKAIECYSTNLIFLWRHYMPFKSKSINTYYTWLKKLNKNEIYTLSVRRLSAQYNWHNRWSKIVTWP